MVTTKCHLPVVKVSILWNADSPIQDEDDAGIADDDDDDEDEGASNLFPLDANAMYCHPAVTRGCFFNFFGPVSLIVQATWFLCSQKRQGRQMRLVPRMFDV